MAEHVDVTHPVLQAGVVERSGIRHLNWVARSTRVELRQFSDTPRVVTKVGGLYVFESEGRAWTNVVGSVRKSGNQFLDISTLRDHLTNGLPPRIQDCIGIQGYLPRSPLCGPVGKIMGRGEPDPTQRSYRAEWNDGERAACKVRAFMNDRFRVEGRTVYVRYERLYLGTAAGPERENRLSNAPRTERGFTAHRRIPDGIDPPRYGNGCREHDEIPLELLGDEDATWFANAMPEAARWALEGAADRMPADVVARAQGIRARLDPIVRDAYLLYVTDEAVLPALVAVSEAASLLSGLEADTHSQREDRVNWSTVAHVLDSDVIPRIVARPALDLEDIQALSGLAP